MNSLFSIRQDLGRRGFRVVAMIVVALLSSMLVGRGWAATGAEVAKSLNAAYQQSTVTACGKDPSAALWCSGVLARIVDNETVISKDAAFLRKDTTMTVASPLSHTALAFTLPAGPQLQGRPVIQAWCVLPEGPNAWAVRSSHGCWSDERDSHAGDADPSSCVLSVSGDLTYESWKKWRDAGNVCSFSAQNSEFSIALQASKSLQAIPGIPMPEWQVADLKANVPANMALIYPKGNGGEQLQARKLRADWKNSGVVLPVLAFSQTDGFTELLEDNPGEMADQLNARLHDRSPCIQGGKAIPAYYCSGLIVRVFSGPYPYTVSPAARERGAVSFSYLRSDTGSRALYGWDNAFGIILKPSADVLKKRVQCLYSLDADTGTAHDWRDVLHSQCSNSQTASSLADPGSCKHELKLDDEATSIQWLIAYQLKHYTDRTKTCSFSVRDTAQFDAAIGASAWEAANVVDVNAGGNKYLIYNEMVLSPWDDTDIPDIEAFFYVSQKAHADLQQALKDVTEGKGNGTNEALKNRPLVPIVHLIFDQASPGGMRIDSD
ncbi:hypothetical protein PMI16_02599 [Herbaspirillum sp. CF444]|uniref:hypothetical protein n=1 Tax=Herbaspirillum sp. CF444 TaxID=1144319 RepID=UPI00027257D7|nr:hypothetical protein [Herbaspirillum sp. CF444]EJL88103.1 hypothetical protein PMI16_02599 [Herbaspirillum sp. CF444]